MSLKSVLKIYLFVLLMLLSTVVEAEGVRQPESSGRIYVIEKESLRPVVITNDAGAIGSGQIMLRDPSLKSSERPAPKIEKKKIVATIKKPARRNGRMIFSPAKINGNLKKPRVDFQEEYLNIGISEESYGADFFPKVNDPLKDSEF